MPSVLVTGADGFIGSHLAEALVDGGYRVRAVAQYNSFGQAGWLDSSALRNDMEIVLGDVRDPEWCRAVLRDVDVVLHLAALIAIPYSYQAPRSYIETNVLGTLNMCQASLEAGVERFVQMSTSEVYGTAQTVPIREDHAISPQSPYAASKVGADALARSFQRSFGLPVCIARPFNTYGPRQSRRAFIPAVATQVLTGVPTIRVGDLSPTRDLTFVSDTARALLLLAEAGPVDGTVVNVGSGTEHSMEEVVSLIQEIAGTAIPVEVDEVRLRPAASEVHRLVCDNTQLRDTVNFQPTTTLRQGLEATMEWLSTSGLATDGSSRYVV